MVDDANAQVRALQVDGLVNARDLGGLPRRNGSLTPRGVFFRNALLGLDLDSLLASSGLSDADRVAIRSWRGSAQP